MAEQQLPAGPLEGVVGWRSAGGSGSDALPESLTRSDSGLYVQGLNELMDLSVVRHVVPEGKALADWLEEITDDTLTKLATATLAAHSAVPSQSLLQDKPLVPWPARASVTEPKSGRFVAFELHGRRARGVNSTLTRIGIQLDSPQPSVPLYVYRSDNPVAVRTMEVSVPRGGYPAWHTLVEPLSLEADTQYFVGYYEEDLMGYAVRRDWKPAPCYCTGDTWPDYKHYQPRSVVFPTAAINEDRSRPVLSSLQVVDASLGLNVELTAACDPLAVLGLPVNRGRMAEAIQMALGLRVLNAIVSSSNLTQMTQRADIQADALALIYNYQARLYGGKEHGTDNYHPSLLSRLSLDTSSLDGACLPAKKPGITVGHLSR